MQIDITLKNYRSFPINKPAHLSLRRRGFTALVGPNNVGKSSLLRFFYEFRDLFRLLGNDDFFLAMLRGDLGQFQLPSLVTDATAVFCDANEQDLEIELRVSGPIEDLRRPPPEWVRLQVHRPKLGDPHSLTVTGQVGLPGWEGDRKTLSIGNQVAQSSPVGQIADLAPFYQAATALSHTLYIPAFRNAINVGAKNQYYDIDVGQAFVRMWRAYQSGTDRALRRATLDLTNDVKRIFGFKELAVRDSQDGETLIVFVNGRTHTLSEVGSGITQFVLVLANVFVRRPTYILIDEPEMSLHAALQLDFLTTIASYATEGVVFSTHNVGLARAVADPIYSVRQDADDYSEIVPFEATPSLPEFLGELGFSAYRELGYDRVLLVEGPTDVRTMQQFLRKLGKHDHEIVLIPLGGRMLIGADRAPELAELRRLSDRVAAVIDSERVAPGVVLDATRRGFADACAKLGINCHVLDRRATENYFTERAVQQVKGPRYGALKPYQKLNELQPTWTKDENWQIAQAMTVEELNETDLGQFLRTL